MKIQTELMVAEISRKIRQGVLTHGLNLEDDIRGIVLSHIQHGQGALDCHHPHTIRGECIECGARLIPIGHQ